MTRATPATTSSSEERITGRTAVEEVAGIQVPDGAMGRAYDRHGEKLRYLVVGVWNTALGYVVFLLALRYLGPSLQALPEGGVAGWISRYYYLVLQWAVWVLMVVNSTVMMKYFAFRSKGHLLHQIGRAYLVYLPAQGISTVILWLTVKVLSLSPAIGQLITVAFATVFSYIGHKYFTFRIPLEVGEVIPEDVLDGS
jgi:putative flippase GtrA